MRPLRPLFLLLMLFAVAPAAKTEEAPTELCLFQDERGVYAQVTGKDNVPEAFREKARCIRVLPKAEGNRAAPVSTRSPGTHREIRSPYASPSEITLDGNLRSVSMNSTLGPIRLRWPRGAEVMFGRTPERAMADAARTASRALKSLSFPPEIQSLRLEWDVVFIEGTPSASEVPSRLLESCHPAWMIPPANIFVIAERVAGSCGGAPRRAATIADGDLASTLLHEIGHAVEFHLLGTSVRHEAARAEGFASWFEAYAGRYSGLITDGELKRSQMTRARSALENEANLQRFGYSSEEYGLAAAYFHLAFEKRGVGGILRTYERMKKKQLPYVAALLDEFGWSEKQLRRELIELVGRNG